MVLFLSTSNEAGTEIREMIAELETQRCGKVKMLNISIHDDAKVNILRMDNAKEFLSHRFKQWMH